MQGRVVCLSRHGLVFTVTAFQAISGEESLPGLQLRSQGRHQTRRFTAPQELQRDTQNVEEMPQNVQVQ